MKLLSTFVLLASFLLFGHSRTLIKESTFKPINFQAPIKSPFKGHGSAEVFIAILVELSGNVWQGFVSSLYGDDLEIQRGECFGQKTFGNMRELTRVTSTSSPQEFYKTLAGIVMNMH